MVTSRTLPSPKLLRNLSFSALAGLLAVGAIALVQDNLALERQESAIESETTAFIRRSSLQSDNGSAIALKKKAAALGIAIEYPSSASSVQVNASEKRIFSQLEKPLDRYITAQGKTGFDKTQRSRFDALPPELTSYLNAREQKLTLLRNTLRFHKTPEWERNGNWLESGDPGTMPDFGGLLRLQNLLLADAIAQYDRGNQARTFENLDAAWVLSESLKNRPELKAQRTYFKLIRTHLGMLRRLDNLPPQWQQRLSQRNYRSTFNRALESEALLQYNATQRFRPTKAEKLAPILTPEELQALKGGGMPARNQIRHIGIDRYQAIRRLHDSLPHADLYAIVFPQESEKETLLQRDFAIMSPSIQEALRELTRVELETKSTLIMDN
ncbi:hypothetical protein [Oscillatoria sp. FACHB-1406]|uniref:hypothetical protein n=1 Tax=Oscillatoria sp. FACHB-1406 TaxID=2692846 RepID=UPI001682201A|nr:hypothetical protein [Oscillatoria sp. FACHB-1406]MBD2578910.1 hypothetical protein [Oscillatoria sp. FACHB-1406]